MATEDGMVPDTEGPEGCYLIFEPSSGGRLMLYYSKGPIPTNAIGFFCAGPGRSIQGFKFKQAGGRSELIKGIAGGDQNRRKYFSGWVQFIKLAKQFNGYVIKFPNSPQGVEVDVIAYKTKEEKAFELDLDSGLTEVGVFDAIAVVPKHNPTFHGIHTIVKTNFLEMGQLAGAASTL
jgi:Immune Mapped Protein 2 (IMP2) N-terminal domain